MEAALLSSRLTCMPDAGGMFGGAGERIDRRPVTADDLDYVNAHATSTPLGDDAEARAISTLVGGRSSLLVSSTKGHTGHLLGAAGALEGAFAVMAIAEGKVPATRNLASPSGDFGWSHVSTSADQPHAELPVRAALSNSFGFGGTNTSLLFTAHER